MKLYPEIRGLMQCAQESQRQLALAMDRSASYVSERFTGRGRDGRLVSFELEECYWIMERYGIPKHRLHEVFPPMYGLKPYAGQRDKRQLRLAHSEPNHKRTAAVSKA